MSSSPVWPPSLDWCLYEIGHLIVIGFICLIIKPLWTLTKGRPVLIIVFSKAIMALLDDTGTLLYRTANRVKEFDPLEISLFIWRLENRLMHSILQFGLMLHIAALALNRMHCIMWPFHYNGWISKKKIIVQCILIWILGILIGTGMHYMQMREKNIYQASIMWILLIAIGLYLIVGAKLAWKKYSSHASDHSRQSAMEKDFNKITIVCMSGLVPILINLVAQTIAVNNSENETLAYHMQLFQTTLGPFIYCADELGLLLLLAEFRQIINKFLRAIFCCGWNNNNANNSQNNRVMPIAKNEIPPISTSIAPLNR